MTRRKKTWSNLPHRIVAWSAKPSHATMLVGVLVFLFAACGIVDRTWVSPDEVTPPEARFGWNPDVAAKEAPALAARMPRFAITGADGEILSGAGKNAELWKWAKIVNDGKHIPTFKQEDSDCCSMGSSNAIAYCQAFQIGKDGKNERLMLPFQPFNYGGSRVWVGRGQLGRGGGSTGAWSVQCAISYGVLSTEDAHKLGFVYSGRLASQWGQTGPPKATQPLANPYRIKTTARISTWVDLRDSLVFGHPVTVASNVGFDGNNYHDQDGKRWLYPRGTWPHQMCFIGVEDRPGRIKGAYIINSWGPDAHPKPIDGAPPGGFWVDQKTAVRMLSQGDSWAYSDFDGFKAPDDSGADFESFKLAADDAEDVEHIALAEQPEPPPPNFLETRKMFSLPFLYTVILIGIALIVGGFVAKNQLWKHTGAVGALLIAGAFLGVSDRAVAGHRKRLARMQYHSPVQVAAANSCNCPSGACCGGNCTNCPANACANGRCPTGYKPAAGKKADPAAGLSPDQKPDPKATQAESHTASDFAAFGAEAKPEAELPNVWTSFPMARQLRTYADCFEHEPEFVLVIGSEVEALQALEVSDKPVAHENTHAQIEHGTWHVFDSNGHKLIEPIEKQFARHVGAVHVRR